MRKVVIKFDNSKTKINLDNVGLISRTDNILTIHRDNEIHIFNMEFIIYYIVEELK